MAGSPKKRNKKYVPKVDLHSKQIGQILKTKGTEGLMGVYKQMKAPNTRYLEMTWDFLEAERILVVASALHDVPVHELPLDVTKNVYSGDLLIALSKHLISPKQKFEISINTDVRNLKTGEIFTVPYHYVFKEPINYAEFMDGGKHKVDRGQGIKTRWRGLSDEWSDAVQGKFPSNDYEFAGAKAKLSVNARILAHEYETDLRKTKFLNSIKLLIK